MENKKPDYDSFVSVVIYAINSRLNGEYGAETFCNILEFNLKKYNITFTDEYDEKKATFAEKVSRVVSNIISKIDVQNMKKLEKKAVYDQAYEEIKQVLVDDKLLYTPSISKTSRHK